MGNLLMSKRDYFFGTGDDCVPFNNHYYLYANECARKRESIYAGCDNYLTLGDDTPDEDCDDEDCDEILCDDYEGECNCFDDDNRNLWMEVSFEYLLEMAFEDVADKIFS